MTIRRPDETPTPFPRRKADALCTCGHGRSVHGGLGSGTRECHACRDACAAGAWCPTAGACCADFVEVGGAA